MYTIFVNISASDKKVFGGIIFLILLIFLFISSLTLFYIKSRPVPENVLSPTSQSYYDNRNALEKILDFIKEGDFSYSSSSKSIEDTSYTQNTSPQNCFPLEITIPEFESNKCYSSTDYTNLSEQISNYEYLIQEQLVYKNLELSFCNNSEVLIDACEEATRENIEIQNKLDNIKEEIDLLILKGKVYGN